MNGVQQTVIYEQAMDLNFLDEVYRIPGRRKDQGLHPVRDLQRIVPGVMGDGGNAAADLRHDPGGDAGQGFGQH